MVFSKNKSIISKKKKSLFGQTTIETLIIFSVSLLIITIILGMVFNQLDMQRDFEQRKLGETSLKILASEINDAYFLGPGTTKTVVVTIPELTNFRKSFIYQNNLVLNVAGTDLSETTSVIVKGNWPVSSGSYSFRITVFSDFVSINGENLNFVPQKIQEKVYQSSEKDVNLIITNNSNFVKNYQLSIIPFQTTKATLTNNFENNSFTIVPQESIIIPLTLSCASDSAGTYVGGLNFTSDTTLSFPIILTCESSQEKLSIFPGNKTIEINTNSISTQTFSVCNNSSNDLYVTPNITGTLNQVAVTKELLFVSKNSCTNIDLNLFSTNPGNFLGNLRISAAGFISSTDINSNFYLPPLKYFFKSVNDNNLNNWFSFGKNVVQREIDLAWVATGELDWNKNKNFEVNGDGWDQNLIAYYKFNTKINENGIWKVIDSVKGNDGNLMNGADINSNGLWDSNALLVDGLNQYVEIKDNSNLKVSEKLSVFAWIKPKDVSKSIQGVVGKYQNVNKREWDLRISQKGYPQGRISVQFGTSEGTYSGRWGSNDSHIVEDEWCQIGFTFSNGVVKIYHNGIEVPSRLYEAIIPTTISNFDAPLTIGQDQGYYFDGLIDEVTIWDKNLSSEEVLELYNSHASAKFVDKNIYDAGTVVDWNAIKINSNFNYNFGGSLGVSSIDINLYSCVDSLCNQKSSSNFITDINSGVFVPILINNSRYVGFDVYFKGLKKYSTYGDNIYAGSFIKDVNFEYR